MTQIPKKWIGCEVEADYFGDERKIRRAERKRATAQDRSKYKKTDQKKLSKQPRVEQDPSAALERGRVLSIASQGIVVEHGSEKIVCTLRGALKKDKTLLKNLVVVGDFVLFAKNNPQEGIIAQVEPRRTVLSRAENLSRRKEQLIAANIDQVIITVSVVSPELKPFLVDRYIIAAQKGRMTPLIVINKLDLLDAEGYDPALRKKDREFYEEMARSYKQIGILLIGVSLVTGEGIDRLKEAMQGKASVFSGQSGVGKSSLINAVAGLQLRIGEMVEKTNKGSHTTTTAHLIPLECGGWCIDTPGIKSFGVWDLDREEIEHYFEEIFTCGHACRFPDCTHTQEIGCAVIAAVEAAKISPLRYASYQMLRQTIVEDHYRR